MHEARFLVNIGIALLAALGGGLLARLCRLPPLIGYLLAGVLVGPHTPGLYAQPETIHAVANLGVVLLMFAVGVHFSLDQLKAVQRIAFLGGGLLLTGMIVLGILIGSAFGWGVYGGLFLGCALFLSSTAVMMRILEERGETETKHGTIMLGILVVQDFSLVLMAAFLPALTSSSGNAGALLTLGTALVRAGLFLGVTLLLAWRGVPYLMSRIARLGSQELFLLTGVGICLVAAVAAEMSGLGLALGAFIAGIVISETDYAHELFRQIRPLRDVFAALFFVSVGMLLDPVFLEVHWQAVFVVVLAIIVGKALFSTLAIYALGYHGRTAILAGLGLAQIGEFSFVLAGIGSDRKLIAPEISGVILSAALITLLLAPFVYRAAGPLYDRLNRIPVLSRRLNRFQEREPGVPDSSRSDARALVLGYGRIGRYVSDALTARNVPHLIVDYDGKALEGLRQDAAITVYGDASSETVLKQVLPTGLELVIVSLPEAAVVETAVQTLRRLRPDLAIVARVHRGADIPRIRKAGADAVIHAEFEASTEMIRQSLGRLGFTAPVVNAYIEDVRLHRYREETV